jgi:hypothetical protein
MEIVLKQILTKYPGYQGTSTVKALKKLSTTVLRTAGAEGAIKIRFEIEEYCFLIY